MATAGPYASVPFRTYKLYAISSYSDHRPLAISHTLFAEPPPHSRDADFSSRAVAELAHDKLVSSVCFLHPVNMRLWYKQFRLVGVPE